MTTTMDYYNWTGEYPFYRSYQMDTIINSCLTVLFLILAFTPILSVFIVYVMHCLRRKK